MFEEMWAAGGGEVRSKGGLGLGSPDVSQLLQLRRSSRLPVYSHKQACGVTYVALSQRGKCASA